MIRQPIPRYSVKALLVAVLLLPLSLPGLFAGDTNNDLSSSNLRGVYYGTVEGEKNVLVGKIGVALVDESQRKQVPLDYAFNSGDKFRFLVSSNHDGFLYILHRSADNNLKQLWPDPRINSYFKISSKQTYDVPPAPGAFVFDEEVGQEQFYIAVRTEPRTPTLGVFESVDKVDRKVGITEIGENSSDKEVEWVIRGNPFGENASRGVVFDPGKSSGDIYRYFSAVPGDLTTSAMVELMLRHK